MVKSSEVQSRAALVQFHYPLFLLVSGQDTLYQKGLPANKVFALCGQTRLLQLYSNGQQQLSSDIHSIGIFAKFIPTILTGDGAQQSES